MRELVLQRSQRDGGFALAQHHDHDRGAVGLGTTEQRLLERGEDLVFQGAERGFHGSRHENTGR